METKLMNHSFYTVYYTTEIESETDRTDKTEKRFTVGIYSMLPYTTL